MVNVLLQIRTSSNCIDTFVQSITIPYTAGQYSISGKVKGKSELLSSGIIVLYKKNTSGRFILSGANIITNGLFRFEQLKTGKYIIYAIPDIYNSNKYLPTYYVNKPHWADAQIIDLTNNANGLTLQLVSVKNLEPGTCKIAGKVLYSGTNAQAEQTALKSAMPGQSYPIILFTESGTVITSVTPDESGNFTFESLPYGNYIVRIEFPNITSSDLIVNLSPESPEKNNLQFEINENALSVSSLSKEVDITVYHVSAEQIAVRLNKGGKYNLSIIDITGSILVNSLIDFEANADKTITIGSIPKGIYILKLQNNANTLIKKILR